PLPPGLISGHMKRDHTYALPSLPGWNACRKLCSGCGTGCDLRLAAGQWALLQRYKRFLADVRLDDGREVTAHCANTGSMRHCAEPGSRVWLRDSADPKRKLRYSWEWVEVAGRWRACINTARPNQLVQEALQQGLA